MNLFKHGRKPFLDFLRNLSSQILFFAVALFAGRNLAPTCCDWSTTSQSVLFFILFSVWMAAYTINILQFLEDFLTPQHPHLAVYKSISKLNHLPATTITKKLLSYTLKNNKTLFVDVIAAMVIIVASIAAVSVTGIFIAAGYLEKIP